MKHRLEFFSTKLAKWSFENLFANKEKYFGEKTSIKL